MDQCSQIQNRTEEKKRSEQKLPPSSDKCCPSCGLKNTTDALFCAECGHSLGAAPCPSCGRATDPGADQCAFCGSWILIGHCVFCYAAIPETAAFCSECGLPQAGLSCKKCGSISRFDFCSQCGEALTDAAHAVLAEAAQDPVLKKVVEELQEPSRISEELSRLTEELETLVSSDTVSVDDSPAAELRRRGMSEALKQKLGERTDTSPKKSSTTIAVKADIKAIDANPEDNSIKAAELKSKIESLSVKKAQVETRIQSVNTFSEFRSKCFKNNHEARRFHMASRPPNVIGWQCNYADFLHPVPGGPNNCHCPEKGGFWVLKK